MDVHPPWCGGDPSAAAAAAPGGSAEAAAAAAAAAEGDPDRHVITVDGTKYEVPKHLELLRCLGRGTYGAVSAFRDTGTGAEVAIKKIPNPFRNPVDGKRCLREIKLLRLLQHEGVITLTDLLPPTSPDFNEVYLVTELMDADLHTVICSDQELGNEHAQFFIYQILLALHYLHSANVVHRDLKPLNVLVNKNCDIKLCDFGLARGRAGFSQEDDDFLRTEYVGTRWYRAPEIVLTSMEYTAAVDMWSAGCILGELMSRTPLFRGSDFLDQIRSICEVLGTPSDADLSFIPPSNEAARAFIRTRFPAMPGREWNAIFPEANELQCDMLDKMLRFDPNSRMTAHDALRHEYLADQYCEEDEAVAEAHLDWSFDDADHEPDKLKCLVYHEVAAFHPDILERDEAELRRRGWLDPPAPGAAA